MIVSSGPGIDPEFYRTSRHYFEVGGSFDHMDRRLFSNHLEEISGFNVAVVPGWQVANAIGAALARTTCEVTLLADTSQGIVIAPEEQFNKKNISKLF